MKTIDQIVAEHTTDFDDINPAAFTEEVADRLGVNQMIKRLDEELKVRAHLAAYEEEVDHMAEFERLRPKRSFLNPFYTPNLYEYA